ncbi:ORF6N domain-containing protein [Pectinatus frisingensis]|uniref:ORF6N domain-containing protein n=1 Tax=Pectinatus frisingensis TaxID=865 RepID=UPI0018C83E92|nr:ORF6N domain-containing protein [Pectinatus frisingensis]
MNNLIKIEHEGKKVLTTEQLAQVYECSPKQIKQNFNNNIEKFELGTHYFKLEGAELRDFKNQVENFDLVSKNTPCLYLWTRRGASRHCKMLGTEKAWEMFDELEETYFNRQSAVPELSPQLQVLINLEMKQKEHDRLIAEANKRIDGIRNVVALNPNDWRKESSALINKMALSMGGYEHVKPLRAESYKLLDERMGVDLQTRLTNKRRRMADEGICKSRRDRLNQLDVIAEDKKLIEGYVAIIKEMAIKYGAAA